MFVIGKNFLKDTKVVFQKRKSSSNTINLQWEEAVVPDKEYLQQVGSFWFDQPFFFYFSEL